MPNVSLPPSSYGQVSWPHSLGSFPISPLPKKQIMTSFSTYIMWESHKHDDKFGPFSSSYRNGGEEKDTGRPSSTHRLENRNYRVTGVCSPEPYPET